MSLWHMSMSGRAMGGRWILNDLIKTGYFWVLHSLGAIDRDFCSSSVILGLGLLTAARHVLTTIDCLSLDSSGES